MTTNEDDEDFRTDGLGVLGGEGGTFLEKVTTSTTPAGIASKCTCGQCSRQCVVTVGYEEAVIGSLKLMPPDWQYDQRSNSIYPNVACGACPYLLKLLFTPQELKRHVERAVSEGLLPRQQVQAWLAKYQPMAPR